MWWSFLLTKTSILDVWHVSEYAFRVLQPGLRYPSKIPYIRQCFHYLFFSDALNIHHFISQNNFKSSETNAEAATRRCSVKIGVLNNFTKFTGKRMCQSFFFDKVAGLRPATLLKKRLWQSCFLWICEIFKNTFFYRTSPVAASENVQLYWQTLEEYFSQSSPWINLIASKSVFYFFLHKRWNEGNISNCNITWLWKCYFIRVQSHSRNL